MADSNRTEQRLLDSIRKAKAGDDDTGEGGSAAPATSAPAATPAQPARKTTARKAPAKKATAKPATPGRSATTPAARGASTAAPYPMAATDRPQPKAYPGAPAEDDPFRSPGRVWPD
jgi:hypothetical protein